MGQARQRAARALELARRGPAAEEALLHRLVEVAPKHIAELAARTDIECIEAAVLGLQVLRHFGVAAIERPVAVDLLNAPMAEAFHAGRDPVTLAQDEGVWVVSMGHEGGLRTPTQWQGHLVISTASGWLVDLWPATRPDKGFEVSDALCLRLRDLPAAYSMPDGALIAYHDKPENRSYREAGSWPRGYPEWRSTIEAIIEEVSIERAAPRGDASFTRCPDELADAMRRYVEDVFAVTLCEEEVRVTSALMKLRTAGWIEEMPPEVVSHVRAIAETREARETALEATV